MKKLFKRKKSPEAVAELEQGIQLFKATQRRHENVRDQERRLAQNVAEQTKLLQDVKAVLPMAVKELDKAKKEVKQAQSDLKAVCDATAKVSGKVSTEALNKVLKAEFDLGREHTMAIGERPPRPPPALAVMPTAPPPSYEQRTGDVVERAALRPTLQVSKGLDCHTVTAVYPILHGSKSGETSRKLPQRTAKPPLSSPALRLATTPGQRLSDAVELMRSRSMDRLGYDCSPPILSAAQDDRGGSFTPICPRPDADLRLDNDDYLPRYPGFFQNSFAGEARSGRKHRRSASHIQDDRRAQSEPDETRHVAFQENGRISQGADRKSKTPRPDEDSRQERREGELLDPEYFDQDYAPSQFATGPPRFASTPVDIDGIPDGQRQRRGSYGEFVRNQNHARAQHVVERPAKLQTEKEMMQLMMDPDDMPLVKWMANTMERIEHGVGDTNEDIILSNAMQKKLKQAGRIKQARQLGNFFNTNSGKPNWVSVMRSLSLSNPQGLVNNEKIINEFRNTYSWDEEPLPLLNSALKQLEINMGDRIMENPDGLRLFRHLRRQLPQALRMMIRGWELGTWQAVAEELQLFWNSEFLDDQEEGRFPRESRRNGKRKPADSMSTLPPVHIYNVQPAGQAIPSYPTQSAQAESTPPTISSAPQSPILVGAPSQPPPPTGRRNYAGRNPPPRRNPARVAKTTRFPTTVMTGGNSYRGRSTSRGSRVPGTFGRRPDVSRNNGRQARATPNVRAAQEMRASIQESPRYPQTQDSGMGVDHSQMTPSSSQEAVQIANSQGERYNFLGNPNIFASLGLYLNPSQGQSLSVCYLCKSVGHQSKHCVVKFILWLNDEVLTKDEIGGWIIRKRIRPIPVRVKETTERNWRPFLETNQLLTISDLDRYFASQGSPSLVERTALCETYYDNRPKNRDRTHWSDREQWGPNGQSSRTANFSRNENTVAWTQPQYCQQPQPRNNPYWTDDEMYQGMMLAKND